MPRVMVFVKAGENVDMGAAPTSEKIEAFAAPRDGERGKLGVAWCGRLLLPEPSQCPARTLRGRLRNRHRGGFPAGRSDRPC
jgi:hypothetical protein